MSMKLLNIDDLVTPEKAVTIKGVEYVIQNQTVGQMLSAIQASEMVESGNVDPAVTFRKIVETVSMVIPDCPEEVLMNLRLEQLTAILEFANSKIEEAKEEADEAREEAKKD